MSHNLNIQNYNFQELLDLFNLQYNFNLDDLKIAKKIVLRMHPDKSKLSGDYFLFYKKAFDIIVDYYNNNHKQNNIVPNKEIIYDSNNNDNYDDNTNKQVSNIINNINKDEFNDKFNKLFDKNMVSNINTEKNKWFSEDNHIFNTKDQVNSNNMGQIFDQMKNQQNGLIKYNGVQSLYINSNSGAQLYDDENDDNYITNDPFSKLKFDDLRKVHKNETIFSVRENDIQKVTKYNSVDEYMHARGNQNTSPLDKQQAEQLLLQQQTDKQHFITNKQHQAQLNTMNYTKKNKEILSTFLQLKN